MSAGVVKKYRYTVTNIVPRTAFRRTLNTAEVDETVLGNWFQLL
jgi:hypothetical protein